MEAAYCQPGVHGAHVKGGVEGQIGWLRPTGLVPVAGVETLAELHARIDRWDQEDDARRLRSCPRTIGEYFAIDQPLLAPLPDEPVRDRPALDSSGRPLQPDRRADIPLLGAGPADRPHSPGHAPRLRARGLRRPLGSRPARAAHSPQWLPPRTR